MRDAGTQRPSRRVRILRQEQSGVIAGKVREVDPRVRAHEAVASLHDQHAALGAQHLGGLVEHELNEARVLALRGDPLRLLAGRDLVEAHDPPLGLRHHLAGHHQDVSLAEIGRACGFDQRGQIVPRLHLRQTRERGNGDRQR